MRKRSPRLRRSIAASRGSAFCRTKCRRCPTACASLAGAVRTMHGPVAGEYMAGHTSMIRRDPIGVVGSIAAWNYPLRWRPEACAGGGGNTIVIKPSEQTPLTTLKLAKAIADIFPEGVVNVVTGRGSKSVPAAFRLGCARTGASQHIGASQHNVRLQCRRSCAPACRPESTGRSSGTFAA